MRHLRRLLLDMSLGVPLILIYCLVFFIFLSAAFTFSRFNGELPLYLSEIVCSGPTRNYNCIQDSSPSCIKTLSHLVNVFRTAQMEPILVQDCGVRFTSATFAHFLNLFSDSKDSLALAIGKIYIIKSMIAAYFLTVSLYLVRQFHYTFRFAVQSVICIFAFPYSLFGAASEYPAVIATIAMLPVLISLKIYGQEKRLTPAFHFLFLVNLMIGFAMIMANRFETTMFCGIAILIHVWHSCWNKQQQRAWPPLLIFTTLLLIFTSQNISLRTLLQGTFDGTTKVLSTDTAESSAVVQAIGDAGLSVTAPVTLVDNSSRNVLDAVVVSHTDNRVITLVLLIVFWAPLVLVISPRLVLLFRELLSKRGVRTIASEQLPAVLVLSLFVLIPLIARTIWFFQYAIPLILVFLFATSNLGGSSISLNVLLKTGLFSNALAYVSVLTQNGPLYVGTIVIESHWIAATGLLFGVLVSKLLTMYTIESAVQDRAV